MIILPLAILGLIGTAGIAKAKRSKTVTPEVQRQRQSIYETALNECKDPIKLRTLAESFRAVGQTAEADMLCKRAALQELPDDVKAQRREAFRKAMASTDPVKVNQMADAFYSQGATGAAENLRKYAAGLLQSSQTQETEQ